jgi:hypothetical protein
MLGYSVPSQAHGWGVYPANKWDQGALWTKGIRCPVSHNTPSRSIGRAYVQVLAFSPILGLLQKGSKLCCPITRYHT